MPSQSGIDRHPNVTSSLLDKVVLLKLYRNRAIVRYGRVHSKGSPNSHQNIPSNFPSENVYFNVCCPDVLFIPANYYLSIRLISQSHCATTSYHRLSVVLHTHLPAELPHNSYSFVSVYIKNSCHHLSQLV
ncbi:hypothetical protein TNCT_468791 [Trichonephila clavata]|uniref:Uncharacterized protein n=1 Tax=Trichonephila clavata TaxID=2740835 RepID=A0A8X6K132_TRICU|nr:hypothetical protein TNCT_468791 [Trichonephila clavata]